MQMTLPNGVVLDNERCAAHQLNQRVESLGLKNIRVFAAKHPDGIEEYIIVEGEEAIYASQTSDAIWCRLGILKVISEDES